MRLLNRMFLLSILFLFSTYGCNGKPTAGTNSYEKIMVEKVEVSMGDTSRRPYIQLNYDSQGFLVQSINTIYHKTDKGAWRLLGRAQFDYTRSYRSITMNGTREQFDSISGAAVTDSVLIELVMDVSNQIVKRTEYSNEYSGMPIIDDFEWEDGKIVQRTRSFGWKLSDKSVYLNKTRYRYEDGNLTQALAELVIEVDNVRTETWDTIAYTYDSLHLSNTLIPDEYNLSVVNIDHYAALHSKNRSTSQKQRSKLNSSTISDHEKLQEILTVQSLVTTDTFGVDYYPVATACVFKLTQSLQNFTDPSLDKRLERKASFKAHYTYRGR